MTGSRLGDSTALRPRIHGLTVPDCASQFGDKSQCQDHVPTISALSRASGPDAVRRRIWSIIIKPLNCQIGRWPGADIQKKSPERSTPPLTNVNPAGAIIFVVVGT